MLKNENLPQDIKMLDENALDNFILESIADWIRVVDIHGIIVYANKAMKDALGEGIIGMHCYESHCQSDKCEFCITERSIETGRVYQKEEFINGNHYSIKSSPVRNEENDIFAAVEVFRNVTRERKLELELINKNKKMSKDLRFARKMQERMLPNKEPLMGVDVDYIYKSTEMLSGDMFDVYKIDDENIGIYISDIAGNGVSASLMTMFVRQTVKSIGRDLLGPEKTLIELNKKFQGLNLEAESYFTIFYGVFNIKTNTLRYANGGHNCIPIKYNQKDLELLEAKGLPINSFLENITYEVKEVKFEKGDNIIFYTDGVTESKNSVGIEFGLEGVLEVVKSRPYNILKEIDNEVMNHTWAQQDDDIALLLLSLK